MSGYRRVKGRRDGLRSVVLCAGLWLGLSGCGIYSFTGASIPDHLGTVAIPLAEDIAPILSSHGLLLSMWDVEVIRGERF